LESKISLMLIYFFGIYKDVISTTKKESTEAVLNEGIQSLRKQENVSKSGRFFDDELIEYLTRTYEMRIEKIKRSWFKLNDMVVYVNGSKKLSKGDGFYDIDERYYNILIERSNHYYAIVLDKPEKTFVIPGRFKHYYDDIEFIVGRCFQNIIVDRQRNLYLYLHTLRYIRL
jgi:hypothetical protein